MAGPRRRMCWHRPRLGGGGLKKNEKWGEGSKTAGISSLSGSRQSRAIFVWCRRIGDFVVNRNYRPTPSGWAIMVLGVAVLALGGCGRKGVLDLPPNASP